MSYNTYQSNIRAALRCLNCNLEENFCFPIQLSDFFMVGVNNVKTAAGIRDRSLDVENAVKKAAEDDGFVTYQGRYKD